LPNFKPGCNTDGAKVVEIVYPADDAKIFIPKEINGQKGNTVFSATHKNSRMPNYFGI
jgi:penicillin-binding protein 1C